MKFLIRPKPEKDESLLWYIYRLADVNGIDSYAQLARILIGKKTVSNRRLILGESFELNSISHAIQHKFEIFSDMTFSKNIAVKSRGDAICICKSCMKKDGYQKKYVHLEHYNVCVKHREYLVFIYKKPKNMKEVVKLLDESSIDVGLAHDVNVYEYKISKFNAEVADGIREHIVYKSIDHEKLSSLQDLLKVIYIALEKLYVVRSNNRFPIDSYEFISLFLYDSYGLVRRVVNEMEKIGFSKNESMMIAANFIGGGVGVDKRFRDGVLFDQRHMLVYNKFYTYYESGILERFLTDVFREDDIEGLYTDLNEIRKLEREIDIIQNNKLRKAAESLKCYFL